MSENLGKGEMQN